MPRLNDLTNRTFGRLTVKERDLERTGSRVYWWCVCRCSPEIRRSVAAESLTRGHSTSCGCYMSEAVAARNRTYRPTAEAIAAQIARQTTHGMSGTPTYETWAAMRVRCSEQADERDRRNYFERGIRVCDAWQDFSTFLADMGPRPPGTSIDRMDNDGHYEPGNCRWATPTEQARNRRGVKLSPQAVAEIIEAAKRGEVQRTIAKRFAVDRSMISRVVNKKNWA